MPPLKIPLAFLGTLSMATQDMVASDARVSGGLSPDGKMEVVAVALKDPATPEITYEFALREVATKKVLTKIDAPIYAGTLQAAVGPMNEELGTKNSSVLWQPSSQAFAFNVRDSKRSRLTQVFALEAKSWKEVPLKDPSPEVFKDLGVTETDRCTLLDPLRWNADGTIVLMASGDCSLPNLPVGEQGRWFEYQVLYRLSDPDNCTIKQISLKDHNG
jgi:hypothetical protein